MCWFSEQGLKTLYQLNNLLPFRPSLSGSGGLVYGSRCMVAFVLVAPDRH